MELLRDRSRELREAGVEPYGISRDSPWTHIAWTQALDLNFALLSDWNAEVVGAFGIAREYHGFEAIPARSAFLVARGGTVRGAWRYEDGEVPNFDELVAAAQAL